MAKRITTQPDVPPIEVGDETGDASSPRPDENVVSEIGEEVGMTFNDDEPLRPVEKIDKRDENRWELNPASSSDYQQRQGEAASESPAEEGDDELSEEDLEDLEEEEEEDEELEDDEEVSDDDLDDLDDLEAEEDDVEEGEEAQ